LVIAPESPIQANNLNLAIILKNKKMIKTEAFYIVKINQIEIITGDSEESNSDVDDEIV
jgi:hypothetical protein